MVKKLFSLLKEGGVNVFLPAKHLGKCTFPYAVVNEDSVEESKTGSALYTFYSVTLLSPTDDFASLDIMDKKVREILKTSPFKFISSHTESADGDLDAYKRVLTYRSLKRNC
jgi:hypothetical protein